MAAPSQMSRRLTFLFAVAAGVAIGNLYWAQPLLGFIAGDLRTATVRSWIPLRPTSCGNGPQRRPSNRLTCAPSSRWRVRG